MAALKGVIDNRRPLIPRTEAVKGLAAWATRADTAYLIGLLDDNEGGVVQESIFALGKLKDPAAAEALASKLQNYRGPASQALKDIGPGAEAAVGAQLDNPDTGVRIEACKILKKIGTPASHEALLQATEDEDQGVATEARDALPANLAPALFGDRVKIKICVTNGARFPQIWPMVEQRFKALADSPKPKCKVNTSGDCMWVELSPVKTDATTFSRKIKFARVTAVHNDPRIIYVELE